MDSILSVYLYSITASFFFACNEIIKNYALKYIPKSIYNSSYFILAGLLLTILWSFKDKKNMTLQNILTLNFKEIIFIIVTAITVVGITYFIMEAYSLNSTLKQPINVGILGGVLTLQFVFAFIIDILVKLYFKEKINIDKLEVGGLLLVISGVVLSIYSRIK